MPINTKVYYADPHQVSRQGFDFPKDRGYSIPIPANPITTFGWQWEVPTHGDPLIGVKEKVWGEENIMTTRPDPEYFAPNNEIRANIIPEVDAKNPIYQFESFI